MWNWKEWLTSLGGLPEVEKTKPPEQIIDEE